MSDSPEFQETPQQIGETPLVSAPAAARVGSRIGDYEIKGVSGEDETGVLFSARHLAKGGQVTLKILHDRYARNKAVVEQFIGEARAASVLRHRNVVEVLDLGITPEGAVFVAMEFLPGESLRNRLRQVQRLRPFEAINVLRQAIRGLGAAHDAGIVHGALKPDNLFLCEHEGRRRIVRRSKAKGMRYAVEREDSFDMVKLLDFGMARLLAPVPGDEAGLCGTVHYLSPEQAQGQRPDQRGDIYALGVVFYEMITGAVPFGGDSPSDIVRAHAMGVVIPPSRRAPGAGIDARMDALISRCLKKNPLLRFANAGELFAALDACITDCAFLRDAHRLPGITESGIDLSEGSPQAREKAERSTELPAAAPVAEKPAVASFPPAPAAAPIADKPAALPSAYASAKVSTVPQPAAAAPAVDAPDAAAAVLTPPPVVQAEAPSSAVSTPQPVVQAEAPSAALLTPPPVAAAAETRVRPDAIANADDRSTRSAPAVTVQPGRAGSHRWQVFALLVLLLLGGGIAIWTARGGWVPGRTTSLTVPPSPPVPKATLPPPPPAPVMVAAAPPAPAVRAEPAPSVADPVAAPPVPAVRAEPVPIVAEPAAAPPVPVVPAEPAPIVAAPSAALAPAPPVPVAAAKSHRSPTVKSRKHASRARIASVKRARRAAPALPPPSATVPAARPTPAPEPATPTPAAIGPAPAEPANAADLLQEAQRTRKRGHFAAAISKARAALATEPTPAQAAQAYELIGICACSIGDGSAAREAAAHLADAKRDMVRVMCEEMGQKID